MKAIIWTRSSFDWPLEAEESDNIFHLPLTKVIPISGRYDIEAGSSLIVTSGSAASLVLADPQLRKALRNSSVYTFSKSVWRKLKDETAELVKIDAHDAKSMLSVLLGQHSLKEPVYFLGAEEPAYPIAKSLESKGIRSEHISLYRTEAVLACPDILRREMSLGCVICVASPSTVRALHALKVRDQLDSSNWDLVAIGRTTQQEAEQYFGRVACAEEATMTSLAYKAVSVAKTKKT